MHCTRLFSSSSRHTHTPIHYAVTLIRTVCHNLVTRISRGKICLSVFHKSCAQVREQKHSVWKQTVNIGARSSQVWSSARRDVKCAKASAASLNSLQEQHWCCHNPSQFSSVSPAAEKKTGFRLHIAPALTPRIPEHFYLFPCAYILAINPPSLLLLCTDLKSLKYVRSTKGNHFKIFILFIKKWNKCSKTSPINANRKYYCTC